MIKELVLLRSLFCLPDFKALEHLTLFCFTKKKIQKEEKKKHLLCDSSLEQTQG